MAMGLYLSGLFPLDSNAFFLFSIILGELSSTIALLDFTIEDCASLIIVTVTSHRK